MSHNDSPTTTPTEPTGAPARTEPASDDDFMVRIDRAEEYWRSHGDF